MAKLTIEDFPVPIDLDLLEALNKIDQEADEIKAQMMFCRGHSFHRDKAFLMDMISARTSVYVSVCNALGKYFYSHNNLAGPPEISRV